MAEQYLSRAELSKAILAQLPRKGSKKTETQIKQGINSSGGKQVKNNTDLQACFAQLLKDKKLKREGSTLIRL